MSERDLKPGNIVHLDYLEGRSWCRSAYLPGNEPTSDVDKATCLPCLLACAEYGSEARHRREVLIEAGAK